MIPSSERILLSGNEALAMAAFDAGVTFGAGYPGTPSTEILESFSNLGGYAEWASNEKVAFEVALGAAFGRAAAIVTMKHVGVNVAADPLFTSAYSGIDGPLVVVAADDPGMASSQNEQDSRRYAIAAGVPMFEPADSQEAYDFFVAALQVSARWHIPTLFRMTTRICHSKGLVERRPPAEKYAVATHFERNISHRVMVPAFARPSHHRLRQKLAEMAAWNEQSPFNVVIEEAENAGKTGPLGIISSGVAFMHVQEVAGQTPIFKLGMTHPLPMEKVRQFAARFDRVLVIEEGDPVLFEQFRAAGVTTRSGNLVEQKQEMYRFGELNVARMRRILADDTSPEASPPKGKPPMLCVGCPHRSTFGTLKKFDCIVAGDIGCYTLGAMPPLEAIDSQLCMGASIGMGLGLRRVLPESEARRVVSVIGDSTFMHSGITGLVEMVYNPPATGHVVVILDNSTTAMTGLQEHPGTGRTLAGEPTGQVFPEKIAQAVGVPNVLVIDPVAEPERLEQALRDALARNELTVIIARRPCLLAAAKLKKLSASGGRKPTVPAEGGISEKQSAEIGVCHCNQQGANAPRSPIVAHPTVNVVIAGLGGQGVLTASDILAEAITLAGYDVKKADVHGMSQRGGSVASDVRFGSKVLSPMVPPGEADLLLVLADDQVENNRSRLRDGGVLVTPDAIDPSQLANRRSANVALLGVLSRHLPIDPAVWHEAIRKHMKPELFEVNCQAFDVGRTK